MNTIQQTYPLPSGRRLEICQGNLTIEPVDAIVNAANEHLSHGAGVAAAISKAGGPLIDQESSEWVRAHGPVSHAEPAYTKGGRLPARYVIHAVGPVFGEGGEDTKYRAAVRGSLRRAAELGLRSVAFPAISTGIFGFPKERAARLFFEAVRAYFDEDPASPVQLVKIVLWDGGSLEVFLDAAKAQFSS